MAPPIDLARLEQLKTSGDLPSPKGVAMAIMKLTQQDDLSMAELARVIRTDPAFVGRLIKAANAIVGYGRRPIASVQDALTVLGLPAVRAMALGFSLLTNYRSGACDTFDYGRFWSISLVMAVTAQAISLRTRAAAADESYCLGLLARVGELSLATLYPHEYAAILRNTLKDGATALLQAESTAFAMSHAELSAALLAEWGMPKVFAHAVYHYEDFARVSAPEGSREYAITHALSIARQMGELCLADEAQRPLHMKRLLILGSLLHFDEEQMVTLCDHVAREWLDWGALLNIHAERMPPFQHLSAQAGDLDESGVAPAAVQKSAASNAQDPALTPATAHRPEAASAMPKVLAQQALRVLVADGDDSARSFATQALMAAGHDVAEARDGHLAAEAALDFQPDVLLIDWDLPGMRGEELIRMLRQTRIGRGIYILATSERSDEAMQVHALEAGADDLLTKPLSTKLLAARLKSGRRISSLQQEIEHDREEIRHFAAELAVTNRRLQEVALMDALTGFPNRRFIADRLQQEWAASSRSKRPMACVTLNLDQFKLINDTYGHDVGDSVLRQASVAMKQTMRAQDVIARTAGDEFLVLCPDTPLEAAMACAERLRIAVEGAKIVCGMLHIKTTVSAGVAARDVALADPDALLKRADQSLYTAKQGGRNRCAALQLRPVLAGAGRS